MNVAVYLHESLLFIVTCFFKMKENIAKYSWGNISENFLVTVVLKKIVSPPCETTHPANLLRVLLKLVVLHQSKHPYHKYYFTNRPKSPLYS
jgi:hypothetical protein